jgi:hypothetical protein
MTTYRVNFFKNLTNCNGALFKVCQRSIIICPARSGTRAVEAAKRRFARLEHIGNWQLHADSIEVGTVPGQPASVPANTLEDGRRGKRRVIRSPISAECVGKHANPRREGCQPARARWGH